MKFAILVLLGLCALVSAQGGSVARPGNQIDNPEVYATGSHLFESLKNKADELIKKATEDANVVVQKVKELVLKVQEDLVKLGKTIKGKLEAIKADIVTKVDEIKQKGGAFEKCVEPIVPEFEAIEKEAGSDFEACAKEVSDEYKKFEKTVHNDVENIKSELSQFNEEVKACFNWDLFEFVKCAKAKMVLFENLFKSFKDSTLDAVSIGRDIAAETIKEVDTCNRSAAKKAFAGITELQKKLVECYQQ